ncbi:MAG: tRNA (guanosine(37)-N1)-methyltransferase TrmD [bacterium]
MRFDLLTIFPELFAPYLETSVLGRAQEEGLLKVQTHDIRDFADDKHRTVDDTPYGGGAGMVMKIEPIAKAIDSINFQFSNSNFQKRRTVVLSARGKQFTQVKAQEYAKLDSLTLTCGRYEGIDQRVADHLADEELSIGPYVLAGGELAALVVIEAVVRLLPGVLGNPESLKEESFNAFNTPSYEGGVPRQERGGVVEYPQYTKPEEYRGWRVPKVLLSGNHREIEKWRKKRIMEK